MTGTLVAIAPSVLKNGAISVVTLCAIFTHKPENANSSSQTTSSGQRMSRSNFRTRMIVMGHSFP